MIANSVARRRIDQIRRRWWVVLICVGLAMSTVVVPFLLTEPKYVATSTLVLSSPGRNPMEDATMAVGYSTMFNEPATIGRLRSANDIPDDVTFAAHTVAASPIVVIEATATNPEVAQDAAQTMAEAFRDDTNAIRQAATDEAIKSAQRELDSLLAEPGPEGLMNPLAPVVQQQLDEMRSDSTNQLQPLQPRAGVTKVAPNLLLELAMRVVGGLLLGVCAALGLATLSTRISNLADLEEKTGIEPLVEVPAGGSIERNRMREDRLRTLANIVSLQDLPKSTVLALTDSRGVDGARELAEALARLSAQQGYRTVLVYADNDASQHSLGAGFNDALADPRLVDSVLHDGDIDWLKIMSSGSIVDDRYPLMNRDKIAALFDELRTGADNIVIVAPSIADSIDAQPICAAADLTMVVVGRRSSRVGDVNSAVDALAEAHAVLLGTVLVDGTKRR